MRDYKFGKAGEFDLSYQNCAQALKSPVLTGVVSAFASNMERVRCLASLPIDLLWFSTSIASRSTEASISVYGKRNPDQKELADSPERFEQFKEKCTASLQEWIASMLANPINIINKRNEVTGLLTTWFLSVPNIATGIEGVLSAILTNTWTAFETLAGDLWVATVNAHPHTLDQLAGDEKRIQKQADAARNEEPLASNKQEKGMMMKIKAIHDITHGNYDLKMKMGELIRDRVSFVSLFDIRKSYSRAFHESEIDKNVVAAVDGALAEKALDALAAVRNLIVHKASIADEEYIGRIVAINKAGLPIPEVDKGQPLQLDGATVKSIIDPVVACCLKLVTAIDDWLNDEEKLSSPGYIAGTGI
jgi:hypothetical protein